MAGLTQQTPVTNTGGSTSTPIIPDWLQQAQMSIAGQGAAIAGQDYETYQGPRFAGMTPDQINAQQMIRNTASGSQPDPSQVQGDINYGLSMFDPNEVQKYMSPYTSGVINEIGRLGSQNLFENVLPQVNSTFTGAGQFGSSRSADFTNRAIRDQGATTLGTQAKALQDANTAAMSAYQQWHGAALPAAAAANQIGTNAASNLGAAGALQQSNDQSNLDLAYQDFQRQQNYPKEQLNWYANLTNGQNMPMGSSSTNTTSAYTASPLQQAASVYGLMRGVGG